MNEIDRSVLENRATKYIASPTLLAAVTTPWIFLYYRFVSGSEAPESLLHSMLTLGLIGAIGGRYMLVELASWFFADRCAPVSAGDETVRSATTSTTLERVRPAEHDQ